MVNIVNKHYHKTTEFDVYIGRGSILGNPYSHMKNTKAEFICKTRKESIEKYEIYFKEKIKIRDKEFLSELKYIFILHKEDIVNLSCFCHPKPCHGEIIKNFIENKLF